MTLQCRMSCLFLKKKQSWKFKKKRANKTIAMDKKVVHLNSVTIIYKLRTLLLCLKSRKEILCQN